MQVQLHLASHGRACRDWFRVGGCSSTLSWSQYWTHNPFVSFSSNRRLLTQLEVAKGSRSSTTGDGKPTASAKGPDGVVLYELHSRPEQEKFNETAKVKTNDLDECTSKCFSVMISETCCLFISGENCHNILWMGLKGSCVGICVCLVGCCCHCLCLFSCSVPVDGGIGEASCWAGDCCWLRIRQAGTHTSLSFSMTLSPLFYHRNSKFFMLLLLCNHQQIEN